MNCSSALRYLGKIASLLYRFDAMKNVSFRGLYTPFSTRTGGARGATYASPRSTAMAHVSAYSVAISPSTRRAHAPALAGSVRRCTRRMKSIARYSGSTKHTLTRYIKRVEGT